MKRILIYLLVSILLYSCGFGDKVIQPLNTNSIKESKSIGAFEFEYYPKDVYINDSINFEITEAWCEKTIYTDYEKDNKGRVDYWRNVYQLNFTTDSCFVKYFLNSDKWWFSSVGLRGDSCFVYLRNFDKMYFQDSVEIKLEYSIPNDNPYEFNIVKQLGSLFLVSKR